MKPKITTLLFFTFLFLIAQPGLCRDSYPALESTASLAKFSSDDIIKKVETRYAVSGFSADFFQTSTIKAMKITDAASGKAFFKRPDMMRWEYEQPDRQTIITDGNALWIYRPEDNQVMIGNAPSFFEDGQGFSFLSDMKLIREKFSIILDKTAEKAYHVLQLLPKEKTFDVTVIYLSISKTTYDVVEIATQNSYGDETRIELHNIQLKQKLDDALFKFKVPQGVEVLHFEE